MSQTPMIRAVIFDLDGTLYSGLRRVRVATGVRLWRSLKLLRKLERGRKAIREQSFASESQLHDALGEALARETGLAAEHCRQWYLKDFMPAFVRSVGGQGQARPAVTDLLQSFARQGISRAVVSDYGQIPERLAALGIPVAEFDFMCSAEEAGALKPSAAGFLAAARALGQAPEHCLVVGDRADTDGVAAKSAAMHFWRVLGANEAASSDATPTQNSAPERMCEQLNWSELASRARALA